MVSMTPTTPVTPTTPPAPGGKLSLSLLSLVLPFPLDGLRKRCERSADLRAFLDRVDGGRPGRGIAFVYAADVPAIRRLLGLDQAL